MSAKKKAVIYRPLVDDDFLSLICIVIERNIIAKLTQKTIDTLE